MTQLNYYRVLGRSGLKVSPLCLGTMTFGNGAGWSADEAASRAIFESYLEQGGKYSRRDLETSDAGTRGTRKEWMQRFGRFTERHLAIADVVNRIAREIERTPAQVAIAWTLAQPGVTSTVLGARTPEQLRENLESLRIAFSPEQLQELHRVSAIEAGFPHDFLAQVRASAIDGGAVVADA